MSWAEEELKWSDLGDKRLNKRLIKIVEDLSASPESSVPVASRDAAAMQGMYDFWRNRRIKAKDIIGAHRQSTVERIKDEWRVMVIQDTTELDFSHHKKKRGLGKLSKEKKGLKVHTTMCISDLGVPLGIIHQKVWASVKEKKRRC
jgi:hypothetical protein